MFLISRDEALTVAQINRHHHCIASRAERGPDFWIPDAAVIPGETERVGEGPEGRALLHERLNLGFIHVSLGDRFVDSASETPEDSSTVGADDREDVLKRPGLPLCRGLIEWRQAP